jgi:hypothetical protein
MLRTTTTATARDSTFSTVQGSAGLCCSSGIPPHNVSLVSRAAHRKTRRWRSDQRQGLVTLAARWGGGVLEMAPSMPTL